MTGLSDVACAGLAHQRQSQVHENTWVSVCHWWLICLEARGLLYSSTRCRITERTLLGQVRGQVVDSGQGIIESLCQ